MRPMSPTSLSSPPITAVMTSLNVSRYTGCPMPRESMRPRCRPT
jgi:hypothetical protein